LITIGSITTVSALPIPPKPTATIPLPPATPPAAQTAADHSYPCSSSRAKLSR
jgi:hypothetical protein